MKEAGLPEPEYKEELGGFSVYFYKDIYTEENLRKMGLNERQIKAVLYVKDNKWRVPRDCWCQRAFCDDRAKRSNKQKYLAEIWYYWARDLLCRNKGAKGA